MRKSFANGNGPNGTGLGGPPPQATATSTSHWELVHGTGPRVFAS